MLLTFATATLLFPLAAPQEGGANDLKNAPPPLEIDGLTGIPIDISTLEATAVFDIKSKTASVVADLTFEMSADGMPVFDLRQDIVSGSINREALKPEQMATHDLGKTSGTIRILETELKAGTTHKLHLEYTLHKPQSPSAIEIGWGKGKLDWDFFFSDLNNGRYMEMWFPSNLLYDHFSFEFDLKVEGANQKHEIVTNATTKEIGKHHWQLSFPAHYTAFSHMLVVVPSDKVERSTSVAKMPDGQKITVDVCRLKDTETPIKEIHKQVADNMAKFTELTGPWPHGDLVTVFVWSGGRSMEYDGATTTSIWALGHELYHSWYGRGVKPASQNDGWFDEAWTVFAADGFRGSPEKLAEVGKKYTLCSDNPWNRTTPGTAYRPGAAAFHRVALAIGEEKLLDLMSQFFDEYHLKTATTKDIEDFLFDATQDPAVRQVFHRYVYGRDGSWTDAAHSKQD